MRLKNLLPKKVYNKLYEHFKRVIISDLKSTKCQYELNIKDVGKLEGKIAIVTGGSGAIGSAICFRLAMEGATVIVCGRNKEKIDEVVAQIEENDGNAYGCILDVTNEEDIENKFDEIEKKYKKIDILINNAGGSSREKYNYIYNQSIEVIENVITLNLNGAILCARKAAKIMIKNNYGKIVNIGSTTGVSGLARFSEYSAAKAGIIGFTKSLAMELAQYNINVNCVSPGKTNQILWDRDLEKTKVKTSWIPRMGKTDDIANAVEFFCNDDSEYIIGQNLIVDGGRTLGLKGSE